MAKTASKESLLDKMAREQEQEALASNSSSVLKKNKSVVSEIAGNSDGSKEKQISAKVNEKYYTLFTKINKAQGMSNNSVLNSLINKYVRENKGILDEDI